MKSIYFFVAVFSFLLLSAVVYADEDDGQNDEDNEVQSITKTDSTSTADEDDDYNPREQLLLHILKKAHMKVPPPSQYLPVQVQVKMRPLHIDEVCTKTYHLKMVALESYNWTDPRLAWNESDFDGVKTISVEATDIWMPDIAVYQSPENAPLLLRPKLYRPRISSDGTVLYMPRTKLLIACAASSWFNVSAAENTTGANAASTTGSGANDTGVFACEFDQGAWTYDMNVVDIIPTLSTSGLAKPKADKKVITKSNQPQQQQRSAANDKKQQQLKKQQKKLRQQQRLNAATREYSAKDFNATTDLSWFEPNQLYDIKSFEAKRIVMECPGVGPDALWSSLHYRLVVQVKEPKVKSIKGYGGESSNAGPAITAPIVA